MLGPSLRRPTAPEESYEVVMEDERASMLERLSEGDRDKVEAAVSGMGPCASGSARCRFQSPSSTKAQIYRPAVCCIQKCERGAAGRARGRVADDERRAPRKLSATADGSTTAADALLIGGSVPRARRSTRPGRLFYIVLRFQSSIIVGRRPRRPARPPPSRRGPHAFATFLSVSSSSVRFRGGSGASSAVSVLLMGPRRSRRWPPRPAGGSRSRARPRTP